MKILKGDEKKKRQLSNNGDNNPFGKTEIFISQDGWPEIIHGRVFTELQLQSKVCAFLITDVPNNLPMHLSLMSISHRWEAICYFLVLNVVHNTAHRPLNFLCRFNSDHCSKIPPYLQLNEKPLSCQTFPDKHFKCQKPVICLRSGSYLIWCLSVASGEQGMEE